MGYANPYQMLREMPGWVVTEWRAYLRVVSQEREAQQQEMKTVRGTRRRR